ncbi:MAG: phage tail tape measure protein [Parabacteroides sp.]
MPSIGDIYADVGLKIDNSGLASATSMFKTAESSITGLGTAATTTSGTISGSFTNGLSGARSAVQGFTTSSSGAFQGIESGAKNAGSAVSAMGMATQKNVSSLSTYFNSYTTHVSKVSSSLTGLASKSSTFQTLSTGAQKAGTALVGLTQKSVSLQKEMGAMGTVITSVVTGTLVSGFSHAIEVFSGFDDAMRQVQAVTSSTTEQFSALTAEARQLGADTSFTAQEAASGMRILGQAGFDANEILSAMPSTLDLSRASMTGLDTTVDIMTSTMRSFQIEASDTSLAADVMAYAANASATDVTGLGEAMKYTAPLAHQMGWTLQETAAAIGILSNAGIKGSMSGTVLRNSITRLISPTKNVVLALESYGISLEEVNPKTHSLAEILDVLSAKGVSAGDIMKIFGMRAGPGMMALLNQGSTALRNLTTELDNSTGYAKKAAEEMDAGLGGAIRILKSSIEGLEITIGEDLAYFMTDAVKLATKLVNTYQLIPDPIRKVGTAVALLGTAGLVAVSGLGTLGLIAGAAVPALTTLGISANVAAGSITILGTTMTAVEWAVGIGEIMALAAALIYFDEKTGLVSDTVSFLYDAITVDFYTIKDIVGGVVDSVSGYLDDLKEDFNGLATGLHLDAITVFFSNVEDIISNTVSNVHTQAEEYRNTADEIETNIFDASAQVQDSAATADQAHDAWLNSAQDLAFGAEEAYGNVTDSVSEAQSEYEDAVNKFLESVDKTNNAGIEIMSGVDIDDLTRGIETLNGELIILNDDNELVKISADGAVTSLRNMGELNFQTTSGGLTILTQGADDTGQAAARADTLVGNLDRDVVVLNGRTLSGLTGQFGSTGIEASNTTKLIDEVTGKVLVLDSKTLSNLKTQVDSVDSSTTTANSDTGTWGNSLTQTNLIPMSTLLGQTQGVDAQINTNNTDTGTWHNSLIATDSTSFATLQGNQSTTGLMIDTNNSKTGNWNNTLISTNNSPFGTLFGNLSTGGTQVDTLKIKTDNANSSMSTLGNFSFSTTLSSLGSVYSTLGDIYERAKNVITKLSNIGSSSGSSGSNKSASPNSSTTNNTTNNTSVYVSGTTHSASSIVAAIKRSTGA